MKTQVSILHKDYPADMRALVESKLEQLFRFCGDKVSLEARLEREADDHRVEIVATIPRGPVLVADVRSSGIREALDEALDRMARKLKRSREKTTLERRRKARGEV